jgi:A/G-specific adenine glycosylase
VAAQGERFEGSRRWYRGRIVAALRALPPGGTLGLEDLGRQVKPDFSPAEVPWLREIAQALAREGLADLDERPDGTASLSLPR